MYTSGVLNGMEKGKDTIFFLEICDFFLQYLRRKNQNSLKSIKTKQEYSLLRCKSFFILLDIFSLAEEQADRSLQGEFSRPSDYGVQLAVGKLIRLFQKVMNRFMISS